GASGRCRHRAGCVACAGTGAAPQPVQPALCGPPAGLQAGCSTAIAVAHLMPDIVRESIEIAVQFCALAAVEPTIREECAFLAPDMVELAIESPCLVPIDAAV